MAKKLVTVKVACCIGCGATQKTLYKMSKEIRMCKDCKETLANIGRLDLYNNGGSLVVKSFETGQVDYIPPQEEE